MPAKISNVDYISRASEQNAGALELSEYSINYYLLTLLEDSFISKIPSKE